LKVGDGTVEVLNQRVERLCAGYEMPIVMAMIMMAKAVTATAVTAVVTAVEALEVATAAVERVAG
jgi:hypothetical protein